MQSGLSDWIAFWLLGVVSTLCGSSMITIGLVAWMNSMGRLAYRRVMRQADTRVDRWERECEFLGVPIHEDTEATDVTIRLETLKPKAREPLLRVVR